MQISVIVPIYNAEKYLLRCITSIQKQTYINLEIILVNDGSTDKSLSICKELAVCDTRIKIISQENKGLIAARKTGIKNSTGELIGFVDSDDWIEPKYYEHMVSIYQKYRCDIICSGMIRDYENSSKKVVLFDNFEEGYYDNLPRDIYPTILYDNVKDDVGIYSPLWSKLFKRDLLEKVYADINQEIFFGEDCLAFCKYSMLAKSVYILHSAYYHYSIREQSMCNTKNIKLLSNGYLLFYELKKVFEGHEQYYSFMKQLRKYFLVYVVSHNLKLLYGYNIGSLGNWEFDYHEHVLDSSIVIYGAGECGQALYHYLGKRGKHKNIVAWVDKEAENKAEECMYPLEVPDCLITKQFDYIIIAVLDEKLAEIIKQELIESYKIDSDAIMWKPAKRVPLFGEVFYW